MLYNFKCSNSFATRRMAVASSDSDSSSFARDPLLPWLLEIKKAIDAKSNANADRLLSQCVETFKRDPNYKDDLRFLKIWFLHIDRQDDFEESLIEMEDCKICVAHSMLYELQALFLEAKGKLLDARDVYIIGISRNAEPLERLKKAQRLFFGRMLDIVKACSSPKGEKGYINPWSDCTMRSLLEKVNSQMLKYNGYHASSKIYPGKPSLSSLRKSSRNKIIEIGKKKYLIKGCAGQGGFALVFKACIPSNPDKLVALKIQNPAFPWEFYMYRQLDERIPSGEMRSFFGYAERLHLYSDYSILVCDYLSHGTLQASHCVDWLSLTFTNSLIILLWVELKSFQDAINSYIVVGGFMEEVLCAYYTSEMLIMLEILHSVGIIHGDFKPDNLMLRISSDDLTEDGFLERAGPWQYQGLCLVDWGRGIDLTLFPESSEFMGDTRTSGFRCIEMQEKKPWMFQVDTYGLCVSVHMMLHGSYMKTEKIVTTDGRHIYRPKSPYKRYWNVEMWDNLFTKLMNVEEQKEDHIAMLRGLRASLQKHLSAKQDVVKKLKQLLLKQRSSFCSA